MESETGARTKFIRKIAVKQRQFNFETAKESTQEIPSVRELPDEVPKIDFPEIIQPVPKHEENQMVLYEPRKKVKTEQSLLGNLESLRNDIIAQFMSKIQTVSSAIEPPKLITSRLAKKIQRKESQRITQLCSDSSAYTTIPPQLDFQFHYEHLKRMNELSDGGVMTLSKNLSKLDTPNLKLDLFKKWHTDQSTISDKAVENLSKGLYHMPDLTELQLGLNGWGYWNENITDMSLNHITTALSSMRQLNALKLDLDMWAYENDQITDKGTETLLGGISQLKDLGKLEINMKGWGDTNENITDESINHLSKCLSKLGNLSEVKLILWDKISKKAIKRLNKSLSHLDHLTKIDLKFENSSNQPSQVVENPKYCEIKEMALRKRKLMFQSFAMQNILGKNFRSERVQDIINKLI